MKRQNLLSIKSSPKTESYLIKKMTSLLEKSIPDDISGMLATATVNDDEIIFYDRFHLKSIDTNNYLIYDSYLKTNIYENIALFASAVNIVFNLIKGKADIVFKDKQIYEQDQKYFRCVQNIAMYKHMLKTTSDSTKEQIIYDRLENDILKLHEIKNELFKIF